MSGIFNSNYLKWSLDVTPPERIMFSTDCLYRISERRDARDFIEKSELDDETENFIGGGKWMRLSADIKH